MITNIVLFICALLSYKEIKKINKKNDNLTENIKLKDKIITQLKLQLLDNNVKPYSEIENWYKFKQK